MLFFLFKMICLLLQSFLVIGVLLFLIGIVRLLLGARYRYEDSIKEASLLEKGDILLTGRQSIRHSWQIQLANVLSRKIKHRFWTHAAIYKGEGKVWEAQPEGVIEKDLHIYFDQGFYVRAFRPQYISSDKIVGKILEFCASVKGAAYDTKGAVFYGFSIFFPIGLNFIFDNPRIDQWMNVENAYFCSELIVDAFKEAGHPISPFDGWRVKPTDFISNPLLTEVSPSLVRP